MSQAGSNAPPPDFEAAVVVTVTESAAEPPGPVHVRVKVSVVLTTMPRVPLVA